MMNLICNKQPRRATGLTVGNEYVGRMTMPNGETTENMDNAKHFYCTNDRGRDVRYSITLFIEPVEPEPIVIPDLTYDDVIEKLMCDMNITGDGDTTDDENDIELLSSYNGVRIIHETLEKWHKNSLSCGIIAITGIGDLTVAIDRLTVDSFNIEGFNLILSDQDLRDIKQVIFKEFITRLLVNNQLDLSYKFAMISDNDNKSHIHWDALDEVSITDVNQNHGLNPNSDREIKFWVIPLER